MTNGIGSQGFYMGSGSSFIKKYDLDGDGAVTAEEFDAVNNKNNNNTAASANNSDVKKEEQPYLYDLRELNTFDRKDAE